MGKRQVGQMEPSEFVVTMLVANLASIPMEDPDLTLLHALVPTGVVVLFELLLSWLSVRSLGLRRTLCGKPVILIENGKIRQKDLRRNRITADELTGHLRLKDVLDLSTVQYAILETNGNLSVFLYPAHKPPTAKDQQIQVRRQALPVTIVEDGRLLEKNLPLVGKDRDWVRRVLDQHHATIRTTFLLTVDAQDRILWIGME